MDEQTQIAERIAREAHAGQVEQYGGAPYIEHLERVVMIIRRKTIGWHRQDEAIAAAWLHDLLEDCRDWTVDRLRAEGVSEEVITAVRLLTRQAPFNYVEYIETMFHSQHPVAIVVKLADLIDHLERPTCPDHLRPRYIEAYKHLSGVVAL